MDKFDLMAAQAYRRRMKKQVGYSKKDRDRVAVSGAPQRDHVAAAVLYVVFRSYLDGSVVCDKLLERALNLLERSEYLREPTWARMQVMARQPWRKLKRPVPKE